MCYIEIILMQTVVNYFWYNLDTIVYNGNIFEASWNEIFSCDTL